MNIAIITGASSGMGLEITKLIDSEFTNLQEIWLVARRKQRLEELAKTLNKKVRMLQLDLTERESMVELERLLVVHKANVKILVNAAGFGKIGQVGEVSFLEEVDMVRLNCEGIVGVTHMVLPFMEEHSRIIQFASSAAFVPQPNFAIYAATKSFVVSYSRALRAEVKQKGIVVTCVCPGPVDTEFFEVAQTYQKTSFLKRLTMSKPKKVVAKALEDCRKGKTLSIYGFSMKLVYLAGKIIPHHWMIAFMNKS